jgi:hypothetical protein
MPNNSNPNVVKIIIDEEGHIPLIVRQSMAFLAASLGVEQFPAAFGRVADDAGFSSDETVEGESKETSVRS